MPKQAKEKKNQPRKSAGREMNERRRSLRSSKDIRDLEDSQPEAPMHESTVDKGVAVDEEPMVEASVDKEQPQVGSDSGTQPSNPSLSSSVKLFQDIVNEGCHQDPLAEWFYRLRIPCIPHRVAKGTVADENKSAAGGSLATRPPTTIASFIGVKSQTPSATTSKTVSQSKGTLTASTLNESLMEGFYGWNFNDIGSSEKPRDPKYVYSEEWSYIDLKNSMKDITVHPQQKRHGDLGEKLEINRYLHNHISHEGPRLGNMKLILPIEWKDEKEAPRPTVLRLPADYESCLSVNEEPKKQAKPFKPMAESQSPEPYQRDESDLQAPDPDKIDNRYTLEETHEGSKEMEELTKKFPLPPHAQGNEKERRDIAIKLSRIVDERNSQYQKHRSLVVLMAALKPLEDDRKLVTSLKWHTREEIEEDDKIRCCGAITFSENDLDDPERYPTEIVAKFLTFKGTKEAFSEGKVEKTIGALLNGVIAGEGAIDRDNSPLYFQDHLKVFGSNPSPDLYVRALGEAFAGGPESWHPWLLPIIFAAECKPQKGYQKEQANAQLAVAFQATMIILILYYLDSRPSATAAIPPWMFLYGIQYTENGLLIRAHCPWYKHDSEKPEWQFRSVLVTQAYNNVFQKKDEALLLRLLAALLKIRSHSWYVLKQLQAWKRGTSVLQPLREFAKAKKVAT